MKIFTKIRNYFLIGLVFFQIFNLVLIRPNFSQERGGIDYYISPSGNDFNPGTSPDQPWKTINKINRVTFKAGDRILFEGGESFNGNLSFEANDKGTATNPITISSYGTGQAIIDAGTGKGIFVYDAGGYQISNLKIVGSGTETNNGSGIEFFNDLAKNKKLELININNVEVSGFKDSGIKIGGWNKKSGYRNVSITNSLTHDNGQHGLVTYAQLPNANENVYVGYVQAYNNFGIPGDYNPVGNGIVLGGVNTGTIEHSIAHDNGKFDTSGPGPVGIWAYDSTNITIQFNESYNNRSNSGLDGGGFDLDQNVSNSVIQYNYSHGNDGAGYLLCHVLDNGVFTGNVIRYNISENDGQKNSHAGIDLYGQILNTEIYNNTIFTQPAPVGSPSAIRIWNYKIENLFVSGVHILNNIFQTTNGQPLVNVSATQLDKAKNLRFQGNVYYTSEEPISSSSEFPLKILWGNQVYNDLNKWRLATNQEKLFSQNIGYNVNPQLINPGQGERLGNSKLFPLLEAYQLRSTSPVIDQGLNLKRLFRIDSGKQDFYGTLLPQGEGYDIGAYEFPVKENSKISNIN